MADITSDPPPEATTGSQDEPLLAQNETTASEKIDGIVAQTRADLGDDSANRYGEVLRQRFSDTGIDLTDEQINDLAKEHGASASDDDAIDVPLDRDAGGGTGGV